MGFAYTLDLAYVADTTHALDNIDIIADLDLTRTIGWRGARLHGHVLRNAGDQVGHTFPTAQGIDNIEVTSHRVRLFEFWLEQEWNDGASSLRAGLYDLNSEFYATESAGLFLNPAFGIGTELAATGANGPSIFPSTALAMRYRHAFANQTSLQFAILNADARTWGDPGGVDLSFDDGVLYIGEAQANLAHARLGLGAWRYSRAQPDIRDQDMSGTPRRRTTHGIYAMIDAPLWGADDDPWRGHGFLRAGISDGDTSAFSGGWQAGLVIEHIFTRREHSALGIGVTRAALSDKFRWNAADNGMRLSHGETIYELTYFDRISDWLSLQPSFQLVREPEGDPGRNDTSALLMRVVIER
ncbi:MAG TPA: carbohydrate porin [Verrucomicrobiae bacterium]|nr:carbohydrate porin [Verrucomicrobiae bacterium]